MRKFEVRRILLFAFCDQLMIRLWECPLNSLCEAQSDLFVYGTNNEGLLRMHIGQLKVSNPVTKMLANENMLFVYGTLTTRSTSM